MFPHLAAAFVAAGCSSVLAPTWAVRSLYAAAGSHSGMSISGGAPISIALSCGYLAAGFGFCIGWSIVRAARDGQLALA